MNMDFKIQAPFEPAGDQPQAIAKLAEGVEQGLRTQVLLGATGTGKTYTIAQVINKVRKPTLVIAHNKTLAAQLASELKAFFPENAVEYFVSYYDYYQPEAYIPQSDTYIEKDASINDEIDKLRHSATSALFERKDVIIVASVSCIYGLGAPQEYYDMVLSLRLGQIIDRQKILHKLVEILKRLSEGGNTVVVIEHNLDVIKTADYIIDIGPEGGDKGGTVVAQGTPEEVAQSPVSYTGKYVKKYLK